MSAFRNCANLCGRQFEPPLGDPERTMCTRCMADLGIARIDNTPEEDRPVDASIAPCSQCGATYVKVNGTDRCTGCRAIVRTVEDETPLPPEVLEVGERPTSHRDGQPLFRRLSKVQALEYAAELAADMETGYYIPAGETSPWPERRFNIAEILRRMGYSDWYVGNSRRPAWWPEGGTTAFKGYVDWKVRERAMLGRVTHEKLMPFIEAVTVKGFAEMMRRIMLEPDKVPFRDLAQFTMRGVEAIKGQADPWKGDLSPAGADAYVSIAKALDGVGDPTARAALEAMLGTALEDARARVRKVVEIPARTG